MKIKYIQTQVILTVALLLAIRDFGQSVATNNGTSWNQTLYNPTNYDPTFIVTPALSPPTFSSPQLLTLSQLQEASSYFMAPGVTMNAIYYVGANGSDTNSGLNPNFPLASFSYATHSVATNYGNLIWGLGGNPFQTNVNDLSSTLTNIAPANGVSMYFSYGCFETLSNRYGQTGKAFFKPASNSRIRFSPMNGTSNPANATAGVLFRPSANDGNTVFGLGNNDATLYTVTNSIVNDLYLDSYATAVDFKGGVGNTNPAYVRFFNPCVLANSSGIHVQNYTNALIYVANGTFNVQSNGAASSTTGLPRRCVEWGSPANSPSTIFLLLQNCNFSYSDTNDGRFGCLAFLENTGTNGLFIAGGSLNNSGNTNVNSYDIMAQTGLAPCTNNVIVDTAFTTSNGQLTQTNSGVLANTMVDTNNQPMVILPP